MDSKQIREKYIKFFVGRGHKEIAPAKLVPENDPTTLFTSSGMQPLVPYLLGQEHPEGKRLVNSQPCFRAEDIEEVGDNRHTTFFEMLGNWSLGDYSKKEQIPWFFEFLTKELRLPKEKLYVSVFEGDGDVPKDMESYEIWKSLGVDDDHIFFYGVDKNWWSRSGPPDKMPEGEIGGPDCEVFYDFGTPHDEKYGKECHPNCECGRFLEIGNSVFIQYLKRTDGLLRELTENNVDFGGGLERLTAVSNNNPDIFQTDFFADAIKSLEAIRKSSAPDYKTNPRPYRIIVEHLRAAIFMVGDGVKPSNKEQGYVLRRLIRRSMVQSRKLGMIGDEWLSNIFADLVTPYIKQYPHIDKNVPQINEIITQEVDKFRKTIDEGRKALKRIYTKVFGGIDPDNLQGNIIEGNKLRISGDEVFKIYETYGLPPEISQEIMKEWGLEFDEETMKEAMEKHRELSRTASAGMFKGGLVDHSEVVTKYHTATHLLHQALRDVLGPQVFQKGSNITADRLRFDFSFDRKMTGEEIKAVEDLVNERIKQDLRVDHMIIPLEEAKAMNAIGLFNEKYADKVSIYGVGPDYQLDPKALDQRDRGGYYSLEFCGGPHIEHTGMIGKIKITKEEAVSFGVRRIRAQLT
ncbi:hypothetical protein A3B45_01390 [Candidatus Daviesbacteria bacterium RIFCSPLOWO2_01_FULL_39_12]|uniref:alanine--tRNA ligase n=1 Tax=Candidatus Daviesbacteria bacterium RIFCSPLOWO2_01_FULL_39_12 TaxID=1797785 RepID=A0A1F5KQL7_9BACT|nr:MAG: hypothetical protein A3B45_01390 [Candidatus Daviesbacteria bacterium RIFCSPLOWO2_01_FULL_39_12]